MKQLIILSLLVFCQDVMANKVKIVDVNVIKQSAEQYRFDVTLLHGDTGWDHYADGWEILDESKKVIAQRILHHPHVSEQPFTRSLYNVVIPKFYKNIYIRAHDKVHGYSDLYKANLNKLK